MAGVAPSIHDDLANLARPRKHYQWRHPTAGADADMRLAPQGLHAFLRAYYHHKSADWAANKPYPLAGWTADELAKLPTYYIMDLDHTMPEAVAPEMPSAAEIAACAWLPDTDLAVYTAAYGANGFQGGLQWYTEANGPAMAQEMRVFSGRTLDVPTMFLAGAADWGVYQKPGDYERMNRRLHRLSRQPPDRGRRSLGATRTARGGDRSPRRVFSEPAALISAAVRPVAR